MPLQMRFIKPATSLFESEFIIFLFNIHHPYNIFRLKILSMIIYDISTTCSLYRSLWQFQIKWKFYFKMFPQNGVWLFFLYYSSFHILVILNFQINHKYAYCVAVHIYWEICREIPERWSWRDEDIVWIDRYHAVELLCGG